MPFGDGFDELYEKVYVPAIEASGLAPLRADEIYNNQPIIHDIDQLIDNAKVILADVTGRNPNVNYELGIAHALKKEVMILTAVESDVPSDYKHLRYIYYNRTDIDWKLSERIQRTFKQILARAQGSEKPANFTYRGMTAAGASETDATPSWTMESKSLSARARELGMQFQQDSHRLSHALMRCMDCHVLLASREGPVHESDAAMACLLNEKVHALSLQLPQGHCLRVRRVFFDLYATHTFFVDYLYDTGVLPMYTRQELYHFLKNEFCGQIFEAKIRYIEENFSHDRFNVDNDLYYSLDYLPQERTPVCFRQGFYMADIAKIYDQKTSQNYFYQLDGLLPPSLLKEEALPGETHWLADWEQKQPRCASKDTVKFKVTKIYAVKNYNHVSAARNINFSDLEVVLKAPSF